MSRRRILIVAWALALGLAAGAHAATREELAKAADGYRAQLRAQPNNPDLHAMLGETLESLGDDAGAMAEYERGLRGAARRPAGQGPRAGISRPPAL